MLNTPATRRTIPLGSINPHNVKVIAGPFRRPTNQNRRFYLVECKCGRQWETASHKVRRIRHCGCGNKTHGATYERGTDDYRIYRIYAGMKSRCYDPNCTRYELYGGMGVRVCREWLQDFTKFLNWAKSHGYRRDLTIDRFPDSWGDYTPSNCRFATRAQQTATRRNMRRYEAFDESKTAGEWAEDPRAAAPGFIIGIRMRAGWHPELAITTPSLQKSWKEENPREPKPPGPHSTAKLTEEQVLEVYRSTEPNTWAAARLGVTKLAIINIRRGAAWRYLTGGIKRRTHTRI